MSELSDWIIGLVSEAIDEDYYTADGERVMLRLDDLLILACATSHQKELIWEKIREFNERNP